MTEFGTPTPDALLLPSQGLELAGLCAFALDSQSKMTTEMGVTPGGGGVRSVVCAPAKFPAVVQQPLPRARTALALLDTDSQILQGALASAALEALRRPGAHQHLTRVAIAGSSVLKDCYDAIWSWIKDTDSTGEAAWPHTLKLMLHSPRLRFYLPAVPLISLCSSRPTA